MPPFLAPSNLFFPLPSWNPTLVKGVSRSFFFTLLSVFAPFLLYPFFFSFPGAPGPPSFGEEGYNESSPPGDFVLFFGLYLDLQMKVGA